MSEIPPKESEPARSSKVASALPYLLALWCCLAILLGSPKDIPPVSVLAETVAIILAAVAIAHAILFFTLRRTPARELVLLTVVGYVGLYSSFASAFHPTLATNTALAVWTILCAALAFALYRSISRAVAERVACFVAFGIALTTCFQFFGIGIPVSEDSMRVGGFMEELLESNPLNTQPASISSAQPDIYYIIVDAYAREDVLKQVYGFDNSTFTSSLRERGFYIGDQSRSNYHLTELSLASSMNMTHLDQLGLQRFKTRIPIRKMISDSHVARFLKQRGYETIAMESGKSDTECYAFDRYVARGSALDDYQDVLFHTSALPQLNKLAGGLVRSAARRHGDRTVETLNSIPNLVRADSKPAFVFSHLLAPHPPFVHDANGNEVDRHGYYLLADAACFSACYDYDLEIYRDAYRSQVAFINQKLIAMVDRIQSSDRESIIIIQADHGPRLGFSAQPSVAAVENAATTAGTDPDAPYREAYSILNAISMPAGIEPAFYASMTPVNNFRLILNAMFETQLEPESDDSFFESHYEFSNVTHRTLPLETPPSIVLTQHNGIDTEPFKTTQERN